MCFSIYATGQVLWALACLALVMILAWVHSSRGHIAWRHLLPGVLGIAVFVAFPLLYTARIASPTTLLPTCSAKLAPATHLLAQSTVDEQQLVQALLRQTPQAGVAAPDGPSLSRCRCRPRRQPPCPPPSPPPNPPASGSATRCLSGPAAPGRVQAIRAQALPRAPSCQVSPWG